MLILSNNFLNSMITRALFLAKLKFLNYSEPGLGSPDCDGDKTLRRHPRKTQRGEVRAGAQVGATPSPSAENTPPASHAAYIRTLTERLSYDF